MKKNNKAIAVYNHKLNREVEVGDVVQVPISNVDLSKANIENLTLVVVEKIRYLKRLTAYYLAN